MVHFELLGGVLVEDEGSLLIRLLLIILLLLTRRPMSQAVARPLVVRLLLRATASHMLRWL